MWNGLWPVVKAGHPPFDPGMLLNILIIQTQGNLGDDRTEFPFFNDRLLFMGFLGLSLGEQVSGAKTIWLLRERLKVAGPWIDCPSGSIRLWPRRYVSHVLPDRDATLVAAPKQRDNQAEQAEIRAGGIPKSGKKMPAKLRQKGCDARWTVKLSRGACLGWDQHHRRDNVLRAPSNQGLEQKS